MEACPKKEPEQEPLSANSLAQAFPSAHEHNKNTNLPKKEHKETQKLGEKEYRTIADPVRSACFSKIRPGTKEYHYHFLNSSWGSVSSLGVGAVALGTGSPGPGSHSDGGPAGNAELSSSVGSVESLVLCTDGIKLDQVDRFFSEYQA